MKPTCSHCKSEDILLVEKAMCEWDFRFDDEKQQWVPNGWDNFHETKHEIRFLFCRNCKRRMTEKAFEKKQGEIIIA